MNGKKMLALLLAVVMAVMPHSGCSMTGAAEQPAAPSAAPADEVPADKTEAVAPGEEKQLKIGFSIITLTFPYYVKMLDGFEAACKEKGWDYVYTDAGMDVEKTVNDCLDLTLKDIDALVIASWYGDSLQDVFEQCKAANIPVFLIDTGSLPPDGDYVTNIGTVDFDAGYNGGYWAAGQMKEAGKEAVRMISFTTATSNGRNRADGFVKGLEEGGLTVEVLNEYLGDSRESYMTSCEDALVTYPELDLVFAANAQGGLGAYDACVAANRPEVKIVGFDCEDEEVELIDKGTQYIASVMQLPAGMAQQTIQNIEDYLYNGATFEKSTPYESGVYCAQGALTTEDILGSK